MADLVAGKLAALYREVDITAFSADADDLLNALTPEGQLV